MTAVETHSHGAIPASTCRLEKGTSGKRGDFGLVDAAIASGGRGGEEEKEEADGDDDGCHYIVNIIHSAIS